jgi:MFS transporter, DHA2 family, multidrug resistance protein
MAVDLPEIAKAGAIVAARGGVSPVHAHDVAAKLLDVTGARQAATLAYADAFLFMAAVGILALCFVPVIPPTPGTRP